MPLPLRDVVFLRLAGFRLPSDRAAALRAARSARFGHRLRELLQPDAHPNAGLPCEALDRVIAALEA
jgi:hypothetical protein